MRATARLELPDGSTRDLGHGDLIGRLWTAALHLDDGRISEAHAMVSLRGSELRLLALRGRFAVDNRPQTDVALRPGLVIHLAPDVAVTVREIVLPDEVLALEGDGLTRRILTTSCSLWTRPAPRFTSGFDGAAPVQLWTTGAGWRLRLHGVPRPLDPGDTFEVDGHRFSAVAVTFDQAGSDATRARGLFQRPLRLVAHFDTVHVTRDGAAPLVLSGLSARILSELVAFDGPVSWELVAREVWSDGAEPASLRRKWDVNLARLRAKLRTAGVRDDLVRSDGTGNIEIVRYPGDIVEDPDMIPRPRPARPADGAVCIPLIEEAGGELLGWSMARTAPGTATRLLQRCWDLSGHPLGPDSTTVIEQDGQVVAAVVGDAVSRWNQAERAHPVSLDGLADMATLLDLQHQLVLQREARPRLPDSAWYLSSLGVVPSHRRRGLAHMLLAQATQLARARGNDGIIVEVVAANVPAVTLYQSRGFQTRATWSPPGGPEVLRLWRAVGTG